MSDAPQQSRSPLKIKTVPISELVTDPENARVHEAKNLDSIIGSLRHFGQVEPLVVQKGTGKVIGGNGRLVAMQQLGWADAKIVELDIEDREATALGLALNRTGELAGWDFEKLAELTQSLASQDFDLSSIGWTSDDLSPIWAAEWKPAEHTDMDEHQRDGDNQHMHSIRLTEDQREVFNRAAFNVREKTNDPGMTDGRCLELICADALAGP